MEDTSLKFGAQTVDEVTSCTSNRCLDVAKRYLREESCNLILRAVEEDGVGDGQGDGNTSDLCASDEPDSRSDIFRIDDGLSD